MTLLKSFLVLAQVSDDFSDGNVTASPNWFGNDTDFIVNTQQQLQLNSSGTDLSYLTTNNTQSLNNCEWRFWIKQNFSSSASNFGRVYLVSDQQNLSGNLNGYYLQFGEALSNDQVELFRQTGAISTSICRGTTLIANTFSIGVKATRDNFGAWNLFIDPAGGANYVLEASGSDNTLTATNYFGVYCKYTASNATKFYFDDFYVGPILIDTVPPVIDSVKVTAANQLTVCFNEPLDKTSAEKIQNYTVDNSVGIPLSASLDAGTAQTVYLNFAGNFVSGLQHTLTVDHVADIKNNAMQSGTKTFLYYKTKYNDVQINEIMADINPPPNGLPTYEYVELKNQTPFPVSLYKWKISDGTNSAILPNITIQPDSFFVLTSTAATAAFGTGIAVAGVTNFPSLNDAGDKLTLQDSSGTIMASVSYDLTWYNDSAKQNGGWSLEYFDSKTNCSGSYNWHASININGGTPGKKNSSVSPNPDFILPRLLHVTVVSVDSLRLVFSEALDSTTLFTTTTITIDQGIGNPTSVYPQASLYNTLVIKLSQQLLSGVVYTVALSSAIKDCVGNGVDTTQTFRFGISEWPQENDIVINEIMFDPKTNSTEWLEIYNRSNKIIDLKNIFVCSLDDVGNYNSISEITADTKQLFPQEYLVLGKKVQSIATAYNTPNPQGFFDMSSFPILNNESDNVLLIDTLHQIIDKVAYSASWHLPLLNDTKGISLERISYNAPSQDSTNWHSAAKSVGYATPAYKNSQYLEGEGDNAISLSPEIFSPDEDGYNDVLSINYVLDQPGYVGNVIIYDARGRAIRTLVRNELLATSGSFFWNGFADDKTKARIGIYIVYVELFNTTGTVKKYKLNCVVGGKSS